jgi:hypothetical protein
MGQFVAVAVDLRDQERQRMRLASLKVRPIAARNGERRTHLGDRRESDFLLRHHSMIGKPRIAARRRRDILAQPSFHGD